MNKDLNNEKNLMMLDAEETLLKRQLEKDYPNKKIKDFAKTHKDKMPVATKIAEAKGFHSVNALLRSYGYEVIKHPYKQYDLKVVKVDTRWMIAFQRNNLDIDDFVMTSEGWIFKEDYKFRENYGSFEVLIKSDDIYDMFKQDHFKLSIKGNPHAFGIKVLLDYRKKEEVHEKRSDKFAKVLFSCYGPSLENLKVKKPISSKKGGGGKGGKRNPHIYTPYTYTNVSRPYRG